MKNDDNQALTQGDNMQAAVFGGGCFWCTEAIFLQIKGVISAEPGYSGGKIANPTYREVSSGLTSHAEVIKIIFDPRQTAYDDLLRVFFGTHDPTTPNRQGADVGTQYRSVIFYFNEDQRNAALRVMEEAQNFLEQQIVTEITPFLAFFPAEDYHQNYYARNADQAYCRLVISPKLEKLQKNYRHLLR